MPSVNAAFELISEQLDDTAKKRAARANRQVAAEADAGGAAQLWMSSNVTVAPPLVYWPMSTLTQDRLTAGSTKARPALKR